MRYFHNVNFELLDFYTEMFRISFSSRQDKRFHLEIYINFGLDCKMNC